MRLLRRRRRAPAELERTDAEWRAQLDPEAYRVLRRAGTERPGSSPWAKPPAGGAYRCVGCDAELFRVVDQFNSSTGWPSFTAPAAPEAVATHTDYKLVLPRREATCRRCGGHLGHVFADGPAPTGERWCINGAALRLDDA
jgi:peptide-methionine (R)-S-oxide reductase